MSKIKTRKNSPVLYQDPSTHYFVDPAAHPEWSEAYRAGLETAIAAGKGPDPNLTYYPPLTAEVMQEVLGWQNDGKERKPTSLFQDRNEDWVTLTNNVSNRRFHFPDAEEFAQKHLRREFKLTFEPLLTDTQGFLISLQHRGVGLILAAQDWAGPEAPRWKKLWPDHAPTMECQLVKGVASDNATLAAIDATRASTLADVLFKQNYFAREESGTRDRLTKVLAAAAEYLWKKTGVKDGNFKLIATHGELEAFVARHRRLEEAVRLAYEYNGPTADETAKYEQKKADGGKVTPLPVAKLTASNGSLSLGTVSALMYLMGAAETDREKYRAGPGQPSEKRISWGEGDKNWNKSAEFWLNYANRFVGFKAVRDAIAALAEFDENGNVVKIGDPREVLAIVCKAWNTFSVGGRFTEKSLRLERGEDANMQADQYADFKGIHDIARPGDDTTETTPEEGPAVKAPRPKKAKPEAAPEADAAETNGEPLPDDGPGATEEGDTLTFTQELKEMKARHGGGVVLYHDGGFWKAWGEDAKTVAGVLRLKYRVDSSKGVNVCMFPDGEKSTRVAALEAAGHTVALVDGVVAETQ